MKHTTIEIPAKFRIYVGKTVEDVDEFICQRLEVTLSKTPFNNVYIDDGTRFSFVAECSINGSRLSYSPCNIHADIIRNKRDSGVVVLTLK